MGDMTIAVVGAPLSRTQRRLLFCWPNRADPPRGDTG